MTDATHDRIARELIHLRRHINAALRALGQRTPDYYTARQDVAVLIAAHQELCAMHDELVRRDSLT